MATAQPITTPVIERSRFNGLTKDEPRLLRWTVDDFERLTAAGLFDGRQVQLIEGEIIEVSPMLRPHALSLTKSGDCIRAAFGSGHFVQIQMPLPVPPHSQPEPDIAVFQGQPDDFPNGHPTEALLVVEVSDTTLRFDRTTKSSLYVRAGIPEYWIINIGERQLEVHRQAVEVDGAPFGFGYADVTILSSDAAIAPLSVPSTTLQVANLLP